MQLALSAANRSLVVKMKEDYFFSKPSVLDPEVVFVEGHLAEGGRPAAVGARGVAEGLLIP